MKKIGFACLAILCLAFSGCEGLGNVHESFDLQKAGAAGQGLLIGSLTSETPYPYFHAHTTIRIIAPRNIGAPDLIELVVDSGCNVKSPGNSPFPDYCGRLVALKLPAGTYQVIWFMTDTGSIWTFGPGEFKPATFTIKAGRATYIGNMHMQLDATDEATSGKHVTGGWPIIKDMRDRDMPLLMQAVPAITPELVDYSLISFPPKGEVVHGGGQIYLGPVAH